MQNAPGIGKGTPFMQKIGKVGVDPAPPAMKHRHDNTAIKHEDAHIKYNPS